MKVETSKMKELSVANDINQQQGYRMQQNLHSATRDHSIHQQQQHAATIIQSRYRIYRCRLNYTSWWRRPTTSSTVLGVATYSTVVQSTQPPPAPPPPTTHRVVHRRGGGILKHRLSEITMSDLDDDTKHSMRLEGLSLHLILHKASRHTAVSELNMDDTIHSFIGCESYHPIIPTPTSFTSRNIANPTGDVLMLLKKEVVVFPPPLLTVASRNSPLIKPCIGKVRPAMVSSCCNSPAAKQPNRTPSVHDVQNYDTTEEVVVNNEKATTDDEEYHYHDDDVSLDILSFWEYDDPTNEQTLDTTTTITTSSVNNEEEQRRKRKGRHINVDDSILHASTASSRWSSSELDTVDMAIIGHSSCLTYFESNMYTSTKAADTPIRRPNRKQSPPYCKRLIPFPP